MNKEKTLTGASEMEVIIDLSVLLHEHADTLNTQNLSLWSMKATVNL